MEFNYRIDALEARACDDHLMLSDKLNTIEIIQWFMPEGKTCYAIAFFERGKEGYFLKFVGNRPFDDAVNRADFMHLADVSQKLLDRYFEVKCND